MAFKIKTTNYKRNKTLLLYVKKLKRIKKSINYFNSLKKQSPFALNKNI